MKSPEYLWVYALFTSVSISALILFGVSASLRRAGEASQSIRRAVISTGLVLYGWLAVVALVGWAGFFRASTTQIVPALGIAILLPVAIGALLMFRSKTVSNVLEASPQYWLVGIQGYRGLGSIFLVLYGIKLLPSAFALPAGFGDVSVAILALLVAALYAGGHPHRKLFVLLWNCIGLTDLIVAVATGFLSAPTRFQMFSFDAPNTLVGQYPLVLIPVFAVPLSIVLHIASLKKLAQADDFENEEFNRGQPTITCAS